MQPPTLPYLFFSLRGSNKLFFFTTNEARKITDSIFLIERKRCHLQYIGETKRQLRVNALGNTDLLSWITNNSAQPHQYHFTLTKLAIPLTTSTSSRLNSYIGGCNLQIAGCRCRLQVAGFKSQVAIIILIIIIVIIITINYCRNHGKRKGIYTHLCTYECTYRLWMSFTRR